jgi:hypothetical protein
VDGCEARGEGPGLGRCGNNLGIPGIFVEVVSKVYILRGKAFLRPCGDWENSLNKNLTVRVTNYRIPVR